MSAPGTRTPLRAGAGRSRGRGRSRLPLQAGAGLGAVPLCQQMRQRPEDTRKVTGKTTYRWENDPLEGNEQIIEQGI